VPTQTEFGEWLKHDGRHPNAPACLHISWKKLAQARYHIDLDTAHPSKSFGHRGGDIRTNWIGLTLTLPEMSSAPSE